MSDAAGRHRTSSWPRNTVARKTKDGSVFYPDQRMSRMEALRSYTINAAFAGFDPASVARFDRRRIERLLLNPAIVRNRLKVESAVNNARRVLDVQNDISSFDAYVWRFVKGKPLKRKRGAPIQARTPISDALSRDLIQRGFKFVGSTICYSFMQAVGMVNDHDVKCFRYHEVSQK